MKDPAYQVYSEFKNSDWYIYWDIGHSKGKENQLLVVWFIKSDHGAYYEYAALKLALAAGDAHKHLPASEKLSDDNIYEFTKICEEFVMDVNSKYDT